MNFENYIATNFANTHSDLWDFYSDYFKSFHGFRPRNNFGDIQAIEADIERIEKDVEEYVRLDDEVEPEAEVSFTNEKVAATLGDFFPA